MDLSELLADTLGVALTALRGLPDGVVVCNARVAWMERQLVSLVSYLQSLISDFEDGFSLAEMGFFGEDEFIEMVEGIGVEIANLKGMIQTAKMLGR